MYISLRFYAKKRLIQESNQNRNIVLTASQETINQNFI